MVVVVVVVVVVDVVSVWRGGGAVSVTWYMYHSLIIGYL